MDQLLVLDDLSIRYGRRTIVDGVDLELDGGRCAVIVGRSGTGKSSLLAAILGMVKPSRGRVLVDGRDVSRLRRRQRSAYLAHTVSVVFRHSELIDDLTPVVSGARRVAGSATTRRVPRQITRGEFRRWRAPAGREVCFMVTACHMTRRTSPRRKARPC